MQLNNNFFILTVAFIFWLPEMGFSQRAFQGQLHFGMVTSQMSGDGLGGWDKFGLNGGALVRTPLSKNSALRAGFIYVDKGSKTKLDTITYNSFAYRLRYLDFPILIDWQWKRFRYSIGPCIGLLIKQDILSNDNVYPTAPAFLKYELAGQLGIGFELTDKWVAEMKFSSSILPVRPSPNFANQYSFYEKGNYNQCIHFALIRTLGE